MYKYDKHIDLCEFIELFDMFNVGWTLFKYSKQYNMMSISMMILLHIYRGLNTRKEIIKIINVATYDKHIVFLKRNGFIFKDDKYKYHLHLTKKGVEFVEEYLDFLRQKKGVFLEGLPIQ